MEMELHFWQNYFDSHADSCRHCWYNVHLHVMNEMSVLSTTTFKKQIIWIE